MVHKTGKSDYFNSSALGVERRNGLWVDLPGFDGREERARLDTDRLARVTKFF